MTPETEPEASAIRQPQTEDELVRALDGALDRHEDYDRAKDGDEKPKPEDAERDYSKLVEVALSEGVSLNDLPADKLPEELDLSDEAALRAHVAGIRERDEERLAAIDAHAQQLNEEWDRQEEDAAALDDARAILDMGEPSHVWKAASIVQQQYPEVFDAFLSSWTEVDPEAASVWASQNPPIDWTAMADQIEDRVSAAEAQEEQQAIADSFTKRTAELQADPKTAPFVDAAHRLIGMELESGIELDLQTPEQVKALLDASVKTAREVARTYEEADEVARLLAPIEERLQLDAAAEVEELTGVFPDLADRQELVERTRAEQVMGMGFRGPQPSPEREADAFAETIFSAQRELHPGIREDEDRTPEEEAALAREQKARRAARMRELQGRRR